MSFIEQTPDDPHWERGARVHGLWYGRHQLGRVGLTPRGIKPIVYSWSLGDLQTLRALGVKVPETLSGESKTLARARRSVESLLGLRACRVRTGRPRPVRHNPYRKGP